MQPEYEVYAIRYATVDRRAAENFLVQDVHDAPMPMDYFIWVIRDASRTILVDTGFGQAAADKRRRRLLIEPAAALHRFGIRPDSIEDIVITHLHYDHAGNLNSFPNARFHLQDAEMAHATGRCMCHPVLRHPYDVDDIVEMVRTLYGGRVVFCRGDQEFMAGISLFSIPGHTPGLQVVRVATKRGAVLLASDAAHFGDNMDKGNPFPIVVDVAAMLEGHNRVRALAESRDHVIPGHDPRVCLQYRRMPVEGVEVYALHEAPIVQYGS